MNEEKLRYENKRLELEKRERVEFLKKENKRLRSNNTRLKNDLTYYKGILKSET